MIERTVDLQEPLLFLLVLGDFDLVNIVFHTEFLKRARDLLSIWCSGRVPATNMISGRSMSMDRGTLVNLQVNVGILWRHSGLRSTLNF